MNEHFGVTMTARNPLPPISLIECGRRPEDFESKFVDGFLIRHLPDLTNETIGFVIDFTEKLSLVHPDGGLEEVITAETGKRIQNGLGPTALFHTALYAALWWLRANSYPPQWLPKAINIRTDLVTDQAGMTGTTWTFHRTNADESGFMGGARYGSNIPIAYVHVSANDAMRPHSSIDLRRPNQEIVHQTGSVEAVADLCERYGITPKEYFRMARYVMEQFLYMPKGYRCIIVNDHGVECTEVGVGVDRKKAVEQ